MHQTQEVELPYGPEACLANSQKNCATRQNYCRMLPSFGRLSTDAMDQLDHDLLHLLTQDARMPATDLAARLNVSRATIQNRIARLKHAGAITRFTVERSPASEDTAISAFTLLRVKPGDSRPFVAALKRLPEITDIHSLSGSFDFVVESRTASVTKLDGLLEKIRMMPQVAHTETSIRLSRMR